MTSSVSSSKSSKPYIKKDYSHQKLGPTGSRGGGAVYSGDAGSSKGWSDQKYSAGGKVYVKGSGEYEGQVRILEDVRDKDAAGQIVSHESVYYPSGTSEREVSSTESVRQEYREQQRQKELASTQQKVQEQERRAESQRAIEERARQQGLKRQASQRFIEDRPKSTYTKEEPPKDFPVKMSKKAREYEYKAQTTKSPLKRQAYSYAAVGASAVSGFTYPYKHPVKTAKGMYGMVRHPVQTVKYLGSELKERPAFTIGQLYGVKKGFEAPGSLAKLTRSTYIKTGAKYIPPEKVFSKEVLVKDKTFPTTKGPKESLARFKKTKTSTGEYEVTHAAPKPIGKAPEIKAGPMGERLMEDPGLYVTPKGEGSPHFLGVTPESPIYPKFSLLPKFPRPTMVEVQTSTIKRLPKKVITEKGFEPVLKYQQKRLGKGEVYITKRSELKQTSEIEAVIPVGTKLQKVKGAREYTIYEGETVPIKKYTVGKGKVTPKEFKAQEARIAKASKSLSEISSKPKSLVGSVPKIIKPSSSIPKPRPSTIYSYPSPSKSSYPVISSYPSKPSYTPKPSYPTKPSYTPKPSYPFKPSYTPRTSYPSKPNYPFKPTYPFIPSYPVLTGPPGVPFVPGSPKEKTKPPKQEELFKLSKKKKKKGYSPTLIGMATGKTIPKVPMPTSYSGFEIRLPIGGK